MDVIRRRAFAAWVCCLWGALAACLWVRSGAPMEGPRAVESALDQCVVTSDRGHDHDPAREPPGTPLEASESEEQCGEDGEGREEPRTLTVREGANKRVVPAPRHEERATPRDPCTSQRNNRGPPVA